MMKIQTLNEISSVIHEYLPPAKFQVSKELAAPDALLVRSADVHSRELNPELRAIARAGAGVNNIPIDKCSELGIVVDERIASGGIYARAFAKAVGYLRNPELLEQPPETIRTETTMLPVSETRQINA